jgi:hypothetical protein
VSELSSAAIVVSPVTPTRAPPRPFFLEQRRQAVFEFAEDPRPLGAVRVGAQHEHVTGGAAVGGHEHPVRSPPRRFHRRADHARDPVLFAERELQRGELLAPVADPGLLQDHHRRPDHSRPERFGGDVVAPPRRGRRRQPADDRVAELEVAQPARRGAEGEEADDRDQRRVVGGEPDQPPPRPPLLRVGAFGFGPRPARPEQQPAEDRKHRRDEGQRHRGADDHRHRHPRPEGGEEADAGEQQGQGGTGDHQRRRRDHRQELGGHLGHRLAGAHPFVQVPAVVGDEEDEVVGEDAEEQGDDHRVDLARDRDPEAFAGPAEGVVGHLVGDRDRAEPEQRDPDRAEVDGEDRDDQQHRRQLHPEQVVVGDVGFRPARRHRTGDVDGLGPARPLQPGGKPVHCFGLIAFAQFGIDVEEDDQGRAEPFRFQQPRRVEQRHRPQVPLALRLFVDRGQVARRRGPLVDGELAGVVGDHHRPAEDRDAEDFDRFFFDRERL